MAPRNPLPLSVGDIVHCEDLNALAVVFHLEDSGENVLVACLTPWGSTDSGDGLQIDANDLTEGTLDRSYSLRVEKIATLRRALCRRVGHLCREKLDQTLREITAMVVRSHYRSIHQQDPFARGRTRVPVAGRVYDDQELVNLVNASLDFWLTAGAYAERFEKGLAAFVGVRHCSLTNSGSSANLLAFMSLTSPRLGERRIQKGDEVITVAAAFPTTVAPIVQFGAVPVFVDIELPTCNVDCSRLEQALSKRTKASCWPTHWGTPSMWTGCSPSAGSTIFGSSKTAATDSAPHGLPRTVKGKGDQDSSGRSATSPPSRSILRTTSPWEKAGRFARMTRF